jgi:hypothetical protein
MAQEGFHSLDDETAGTLGGFHGQGSSQIARLALAVMHVPTTTVWTMPKRPVGHPFVGPARSQAEAALVAVHAEAVGLPDPPGVCTGWPAQDAEQDPGHRPLHPPRAVAWPIAPTMLGLGIAIRATLA